ncbi:hypothetical protein KGQ19_00745 [Catenulispora sp. NL8]|uniref:Uncharacterized protein n=1 Tax=Catenulispora pinistramenti TaxID=2705254 RepID=A0ABS5KGI3_9ACTN|nr:hypothetical protein [Catenulispora pinistramenti]MBS2545387.1 hypothetical protein [Catenulispora pinistramenti]
MTASSAQGASRISRFRRRNLIILVIVLVAIAGALIFTWHKATATISRSQAQQEAVQAVNDAVKATGRVPDTWATSASIEPCDNGAGGDHGDYAGTGVNIHGVSTGDADRMADALGSYLKSNGYSGVTVRKDPNLIVVHGTKSGVGVGMQFDPNDNQHLAMFTAGTGCNVKS